MVPQGFGTGFSFRLVDLRIGGLGCFVSAWPLVTHVEWKLTQNTAERRVAVADRVFPLSRCGYLKAIVRTSLGNSWSPCQVPQHLKAWQSTGVTSVGGSSRRTALTPKDGRVERVFELGTAAGPQII